MSLPLLKGKQHHVAHLPAVGHQVVLGTAGTGKTTMAMVRAEHLADPSTRNNGRVLLVTYNNTLVTYLRHIKPDRSPNITVETYGRFARGYLAHRGLMPSFGGIARPEQRRQFIGSARREIAEAHPRSAVLRRDVGWFLDELQWIAEMGLQTLADYQAARRFGRETALSDQQRERVWAVRAAYHRIRDDAGLLYDWYDIATTVRAALAKDIQPRLYRHIVVDEGQDFSPEQVRSLVDAMDPRGSITFFGDYHQTIYGQGLSWRACGLDAVTRPVQRFEDNYRNTAEIARLAIAMAESEYMKGEREDLVVPKQPTAAGTMPTLVECRDRTEEVSVVSVRASDLSRDGSAAVLTRTWAEAEKATHGLPVRRLTHDMKHWDPTPGIYIGAYHSAKGLEFDAVIMPFLSVARLPLPEVVGAFGVAEASAREARLLYVAITRAKSELLLLHSGDVTSLLPTDTTLYLKASP
jgi:superfamily I DNA/RNA helicase